MTEVEKKELEELRAEKAPRDGQAARRDHASPLGRPVLPGARAQRPLLRRPGAAAQVLPDRQGRRLRAGALAGPLRREVRRAQGRRLARGRALLRRDRREDGRVPLRLLPRPLPARGQVQPRGGLPGARREPARPAHAPVGAGHQLQPPGPRPRRDGDAAARVRPRPARRAVAHGLRHRTPGRARRATSSRRPSQMFEEWGRREQSLALFAKVCPECPRLTTDEIARLEAARQYGQGIKLRAPVALRGLRHVAFAGSEAFHGGLEAGSSRTRPWATSRARCSPRPSATSPPATPPATTATCGRRCSRSTCSRGSRRTCSTRRWGTSTATRSSRRAGRWSRPTW